MKNRALKIMFLLGWQPLKDYVGLMGYIYIHTFMDALVACIRMLVSFVGAGCHHFQKMLEQTTGSRVCSVNLWEKNQKEHSTSPGCLDYVKTTEKM